MKWRLRKFIELRSVNFIGDSKKRIRNIKHVTFGCKVIIDCSSFGKGNLSFGKRVRVGHGVFIATYGGNIDIGSNCSLNPYCIVYGHGGVTIGDNVSIAAHTVIIPANHNFGDTKVNIQSQGLSKKGIKIGNNVWIGTGVSILDGVTIGNGAIVGAGSVVNKNVEPFSIVGGVPARMIKSRRIDIY